MEISVVLVVLIEIALSFFAATISSEHVLIGDGTWAGFWRKLFDSSIFFNLSFMLFYCDPDKVS